MSKLKCPNCEKDLKMVFSSDEKDIYECDDCIHIEVFDHRYG